MHGDGSQTRDLSYVDDTVRGFLIMGSDKNAVGKAVNFGTGIDTTILELAKKIKNYTGTRSKIVHTPSRASEVQRLCSDPGLAERLFGYKAQVSIDEGLMKNIAYAKEHEIY